MEKNYLIIPGYGNSDTAHWQTYFENNLENCVRVQQKSWDKPVCEDWVYSINKAVNEYKPETVVLVAHSTGCIAIVHWALRHDIKIKGAMIVAPADLENPWKDYGLESFTPIPKLKLPFRTLLVASTNDVWATKERIEIFSRNWGSKLVFIGDAGHISTNSGYGSWDEGLNLLKSEF